jgi:hypothetical protein
LHPLAGPVLFSRLPQMAGHWREECEHLLRVDTGEPLRFVG